MNEFFQMLKQEVAEIIASKDTVINNLKNELLSLQQILENIDLEIFL